MYLIKVLDNIIEDLENGRTYVLNESIPDYDTNTAATTVYVRSWNSDETVDLAHELDAIKLWDHLTSLCKLNTVDPKFNVDGNSGRIVTRPDGSRDVEFDATKAQDAPRDSERAFRYKVGDKVRVNNPDDKNHGVVGTVDYITNADNAAQPYEVRFTFIESGDDWDETEWYRETELESPDAWIDNLTPPAKDNAIPF